jgi:hypothetical protein
MAEQITIPISTFEIAISYVRPVLNLWMDRAIVVQKMFDAFEPWKLTVDDVEAVTTGKPSEQGVKFKLPLEKITFFFGPGGCKFTKEAASWSQADETLHVLNVALGVLIQHGLVEFGKKSTSLILHIQPMNVSFRELLRPFLISTLAELENSAPEVMAYVVRWKGRRITLDGSAALANAVFLHLERDFDAAVSFEEIRETIFKDEATMFALLNVEESES